MGVVKAGVLGVVLVMLSTAVGAQDRGGRAERMPFDECLTLIDEVADELGSSGMTWQRTRDMHSARVRATDGYVTVICKRADQTVTLLRSAS